MFDLRRLVLVLGEGRSEPVALDVAHVSCLEAPVSVARYIMPRVNTQRRWLPAKPDCKRGWHYLSKSRSGKVPTIVMGCRGVGAAMVRTLLSTISCVLIAACGTLGPATIPNDQVDYADAMSRGDARLALLNIVKLRYQDVVTFVEPNQVVAGYQLQGQINLSGQLSHADNSGTLGALGTFSNNPTITYSPVTGGDFETLLLTPIPPLDLFALANSGISTSVVLSVGLQQFNGVSNPGIGLRYNPRTDASGRSAAGGRPVELRCRDDRQGQGPPAGAFL
jgi:hypothetical protein